MKKLIRPALTAALILSAAPGAMAAATSEEAGRLTQVLEKYIGRNPADQPPIYTVEPKGDSYVFTVNADRVFALLAKFGANKISMPPTPWSIELTPRPDGKWALKYGQDLSFSLNMPDGVSTFKMEGVNGAGVFDPSIPGVISDSSSIARISGDSHSASPDVAKMNMTRLSTGYHSDVTGAAIAPGVETAKVHQTIASTAQHLTLDRPAPAGGAKPAPIDIDLAIGPVTVDAALNGMRNRALLDLWAFIVAHPSKEALRDAQVDLKALIRAALPLFDRIEGAVEATAVAVNSPVGKFAVANFTAGMGLNGVTSEGAFSEKFAAKGIEIPAGLVPPWAKDLTPREAALEFAVTGFDPARAAEAVIAAANLEETPAVKQDVMASVAGKLLPQGAVDVKLSGVRVATSAYSVTLDGQLKVTPGVMPTGAITIRAKGLDAVQKILTEGAKTDPNAATAVAGLAIARGMAKPGPDGTSVWEIASTPDGKMTVNGAPLGGGGKK